MPEVTGQDELGQPLPGSSKAGQDVPDGWPKAKSKSKVQGAHVNSLLSHVAFISAAGVAPSGADNLESLTAHDTSVDEDEAFLEFPDMDFFDDVKLDDADSPLTVPAHLPYTSVYREPLPYDSTSRRCFLPGQSVNAKISTVDFADSIFYRYKIYTIQVTHGEFEWQIRRRNKDFRHLHEKLLMTYARLKLSDAVTTRHHQEGRRAKPKKKTQLPAFPIEYNPVSRQRLEKRQEQIEKYLNCILRVPPFRNHPETLRFFEVSDLSFICALGSKTREGYVKKRSGGQRFARGCCSCCAHWCTCCGACCMRWSSRWLVVKDSFVAYIHPRKGTVRDVLLMDQDFNVEKGLEDTGVQHGLKISNLSRHLLLRLWTQHRCEDWFTTIKATADTTAVDFTRHNSYDSFVPAREDTYCNWFVDAASYMTAVADALEGAKEEIFIADWWLSPEIYMKRPMTEGEKWRLDLILKRKADAGVKIFVILYKEMEMALGLNSFYTKQALLKLHPENIKVLRHPDGITLWTHHEKLVVIDQRIAFLGGIDLCYGRWDTPKHRLVDVGSVGQPLDSEDAAAGPRRHQDLPVHVSSSTYTGGPKATSTWYAGTNTPSPPVAKEGHVITPLPDIHLPDVIMETPEILEEIPTTSQRPKFYGRSVSVNQTKSGLAIETMPPVFESGSAGSSDSGKADSGSFQTSRGESQKEEQVQMTMFDAVQAVLWSQGGDVALPGPVDGDAPDEASYDIVGISANSSVGLRVAEAGDASTSHTVGDGGSELDPSKAKCPKTSKQVCIVQPQLSSQHGANRHKPLGKAKSLPTDLVTDKSKVATSVSAASSVLDADSNEKQSAVHSPTVTEKSGHIVEGEKSLQAASKSVRDSVHLEIDQMSFIDDPECNDNSVTSPATSGKQQQDPLKQAGAIEDKDSIPKAIGGSGGGGGGGSCSAEELSGRRSLESPAQAPPSALLCDVNANTVTGNKLALKRQDTLDHRTSVLKRQFSLDCDDDVFPDPSDSLDEVSDSREELPSNPSQDAADTISLFRNYLDDVNSPCSVVGGSRADQQAVLNPEDGEQPNTGKGRLWARVQQRLLQHGRQPPKLILARPQYQNARSREPSGPENPTLQGCTGAPAAQNGQVFISPTGAKPSTPKAHRRMAQKAFDFRADVKERFRKRAAQSVDLSVESDSVPLEPGMYHVKAGGVPMEKIIEEMGLEGSSKLWIGKDYCNFIFKDFVALDEPFKDFIDRQQTPRMPWHDIGAVVYGRCARDVARHFIQRWNFTKLQKRKTNANYPLLLPKTYQSVYVPYPIMHSQFKCKCQILRSSAKWSAGIGRTESSIHGAYINLIRNAKHYIYIENQFFISVMENNTVKNEVADAIYERIIEAHKHKETFRVYVVMPLLPAFEGQLGTSTGLSIQAVIHWNYQSIAHGGTSLLERLTKAVGDPFRYISFFGLRTHAQLAGNLVTELIYVHSKLMIVDDQKVIIGSANINDRSLLGDRDSELAVCVEDTRTVPSLMNSKPYKAGWYASTLRKALFREHLGLSEGDRIPDITDPVRSEFYKGIWLRQASINTSMYEKVFNCIPTDDVRRFEELNEFLEKEPLAQSNPQEAKELLERVRGHLVLLPLQFLAAENLQPKISKEGLAPTSLWT